MRNAKSQTEFVSSFGECLIASLIQRSTTWAVAPLKVNGISTNALSVAGKELDRACWSLHVLRNEDIDRQIEDLVAQNV